MGFIAGLHKEMSLLGLLFLVGSLLLTGGLSQNTTIATPQTPSASSTSIIPTKTNMTNVTVPASTKSTSISSISTKASTAASTTPTTATQHPSKGPTSASSKFDAGSFVGGIFLGLVLAAIFVFAFKWWQSNKKSYHSL
ncbi:sialomucin core protein 24-like [Montipora foliosa]|uniref:sialomucin core protein 24-like n=1 Tax=Montipora foliosa TaxID=591990 RepID=UPI0035F20743